MNRPRRLSFYAWKIKATRIKNSSKHLVCQLLKHENIQCFSSLHHPRSFVVRYYHRFRPLAGCESGWSPKLVWDHFHLDALRIQFPCNVAHRRLHFSGNKGHSEVKCPRCQTFCTRVTRKRPRGQRYVILAPCAKCKTFLHIEGVAGITPPKMVK